MSRFSREAYEAEIRKILGPLLDHPRVQEMKTFFQHSDVTTYEHVTSVTCQALYWADKYRIRVDRRELVLGCFLHDFCGYDWHVTKHPGHLHGFYHPRVAARNAVEVLEMPPRVESMIRTHMFPLTLFHVPHTKAAWLLCLADKRIANRETFDLSRRRRMARVKAEAAKARPSSATPGESPLTAQPELPRALRADAAPPSPAEAVGAGSNTQA